MTQRKSGSGLYEKASNKQLKTVFKCDVIVRLMNVNATTSPKKVKQL